MPQDGTPFGGYDKLDLFSGVLLAPTKRNQPQDRSYRQGNTENLEAYGIDARVIDIERIIAPPALQAERLPQSIANRAGPSGLICTRSCPTKPCFFYSHKPDTLDFSKSVYVFTHVCGAEIRLNVRRFARSSIRRKSLISSHACPGYCNHESSLSSCSAECEGSIFRRLATKLRARYAPAHNARRPIAGALSNRPTISERSRFL